MVNDGYGRYNRDLTAERRSRIVNDGAGRFKNGQNGCRGQVLALRHEKMNQSSAEYAESVVSCLLSCSRPTMGSRDKNHDNQPMEVFNWEGTRAIDRERGEAPGTTRYEA
jgi:hypothetical protein